VITYEALKLDLPYPIPYLMDGPFPNIIQATAAVPDFYEMKLEADLYVEGKFHRHKFLLSVSDDKRLTQDVHFMVSFFEDTVKILHRDEKGRFLGSGGCPEICRDFLKGYFANVSIYSHRAAFIEEPVVAKLDEEVIIGAKWWSKSHEVEAHHVAEIQEVWDKYDAVIILQANISRL